MITDFPQGIDDHGVTTVIDLIPVLSHPVYADNIRLILNSPGLQKGLPSNAAPFRPVGDVNEQVVFRGGGHARGLAFIRGRLACGSALPAPYRESQVITNEQVDLPAFDRGDKPFVAGRI